MNLKQLEVFVAVVDNGSFSKGAETCFITQSTVSQHIGSLEREFGLTLLDRTSQGALPTEAGKLLLDRARQILSATREIRDCMERFRGVDHVSLAIGASNIPGDYLVPAALPLLLGVHPTLQVTVIQGDSRQTLDRVVREDVELGIVGGRFSDDRCTFTPLGRDTLQLIVGPNHRWFGRKRVRLDELAGERFVLREDGSGTAKTVLEALLKSGIDSRSLTISARLGSNEAVKHAVAAGLGLSFLSGISVRKEVDRGELASVTVEGLDLERFFYVVRRVGRTLSPAAVAFVDVMEKLM